MSKIRIFDRPKHRDPLYLIGLGIASVLITYEFHGYASRGILGTLNTKYGIMAYASELTLKFGTSFLFYGGVPGLVRFMYRKARNIEVKTKPQIPALLVAVILGISLPIPIVGAIYYPANVAERKMAQAGATFLRTFGDFNRNAEDVDSSQMGVYLLNSLPGLKSVAEELYVAAANSNDLRYTQSQLVASKVREVISGFDSLATQLQYDCPEFYEEKCVDELRMAQQKLATNIDNLQSAFNARFSKENW